MTTKNEIVGSKYIADEVELPDGGPGAGRIFAVEIRAVDGRPASQQELSDALRLAGEAVLQPFED